MQSCIYLTCGWRLRRTCCDACTCPQSLDTQILNLWCCKNIENFNSRHNKASNSVKKFGETDSLSRYMEKLGILSPRRPGDVSLPNRAPSRGLAIDVTVICPLAIAHQKQKKPFKSNAQLHKHFRQDEKFQTSNVSLKFEISGTLNADGLDVAKQIFRYALKLFEVDFLCQRWAQTDSSCEDLSEQRIFNRKLIEPWPELLGSIDVSGVKCMCWWRSVIVMFSFESILPLSSASFLIEERGFLLIVSDWAASGGQHADVMSGKRPPPPPFPSPPPPSWVVSGHQRKICPPPACFTRWSAHVICGLPQTHVNLFHWT